MFTSVESWLYKHIQLINLKEDGCCEGCSMLALSNDYNKRIIFRNLAYKQPQPETFSLSNVVFDDIDVYFSKA